MNASGPTSGLSPRAEKIIRVLSTMTVLALAVAAAILSFSGLQQLSLKAGLSHSIAWLLPVVIDGLVLTGSLGVVASSLVGISTWYPWTLTITGVLASVAGNVAIAHPNLSSRLVHATGPIVFALSVEGLLRIYRASALATAHREKARIAKEELEFEKQTRREERETKRESRVSEARINLIALAPAEATQDKQALTPLPTIQMTPNQNEAIAAKAVSTKIRVMALLESEPNISGAEVARKLGLDGSYARKITRGIRNEKVNNISKLDSQVNDNLAPVGLEVVAITTGESTVGEPKSLEPIASSFLSDSERLMNHDEKSNESELENII